MSAPRKPKPSFDLPRRSPEGAEAGAQPDTAWVYRSAPASTVRRGPDVRRGPSRPAIDGDPILTPSHLSGFERTVEWLSFPLQMVLVLGLAAGQVIGESGSDTRRP